jgi:hypothetical protein
MHCVHHKHYVWSIVEGKPGDTADLNVIRGYSVHYKAK